MAAIHAHNIITSENGRLFYVLQFTITINVCMRKRIVKSYVKTNISESKIV